MAFVPLTNGNINDKNSGTAFIKNVCSGNSNDLLKGKNKYVLPFCTPVSGDIVWEAKPIWNGKQIKTNEELGNALIDWYNYYGKIFEMDANILAAQAFQESGYRIWNYAKTSTASGISQFITDAIFDVIINNKFAAKEEYRFTVTEINAITKNLSGNTNSLDTYNIKYLSGRKNRPVLHQNIIDNPNIMIKAQFCYMKYISNKCQNMASSALFGYNRGPGYAVPSYSKSIYKAKLAKGSKYPLEGIDYVYRIFRYLGDPNFVKEYGYFGYDKPPHDLKLTQPFDTFEAEVDESNLIG